MVQDRRRLEFAGGQQFADRVVRGDKGAGDACGAGAAIGLQHVAVEINRSFAKLFQIEHRAHRAADQALDFLRAAALLAAGGFPVAAGVRGARQHAVFGRHPAFAAALLVAGNSFLDGSGAQHPCAAELDQHRAFGVNGVVAGDAHRAQGVRGARAGAFKKVHGFDFPARQRQA